MKKFSPSLAPKKTALAISFIFCLSLHYSTSAQRKLKDYLVSGSSMLVSGMLDGTIESLSFHYDNGFKNRFPKANNQFWNPSISWKNKYKDGNCELGPKFTGSTGIFVCTTDAYHMLRSAKRTVNGLTLVYYVNKTYNEKTTTRKKWKNIATDFLVLTIIRSIGFSLTYNVLFCPQKNYNRNQ